MKYYIVFARTQGSEGWTMAHRRSGAPAFFHKLDLALEEAKLIQKGKRGWWGGKPNQRKMDAYVHPIYLPDKPNFPKGDSGYCECESMGLCDKCGRRSKR